MIADKHIPAYEDEGFHAVVVHVGDAVLYARNLAFDNHNAFPMLLDLDETVIDQFIQLGPDALLFPLGYLLDGTGTIRTVYNEYEDPDAPPGPPTIEADIEALLAE